MKELAIQSKDHDKELHFFAKEMKAKRFYEEKTPLPLLLNYCYEMISQYGRSTLRPTIGLFASWLIGVGVYFYAMWSSWETMYHGLGKALMLSTANLLPFVGSARVAIGELTKGESLSLWIDAFMIAQGFSAFVFLFFIGLALRNRFRL